MSRQKKEPLDKALEAYNELSEMDQRVFWKVLQWRRTDTVPQTQKPKPQAAGKRKPRTSEDAMKDAPAGAQVG